MKWGEGVCGFNYYNGLQNITICSIHYPNLFLKLFNNLQLAVIITAAAARATYIPPPISNRDNLKNVLSTVILVPT